MNEINAKRLAGIQDLMEMQKLSSLEYLLRTNYIGDLVKDMVAEAVGVAVASSLGMKENPWARTAHGASSSSDRFDRIAKWSVSDPVAKAIEPHKKAIVQSLEAMSFELSEKVKLDLAASTQRSFESALYDELRKHAEAKGKKAASEMMGKIQ